MESSPPAEAILYPRTYRAVMAAIHGGNFGFISAVIAGATAVASVAGAVKSVKGSKKPKAQVDPAQLADAILPEVQAKLAANGVNVSTAQAREISMAAVLDVFGTNNRPFVLAGLGVVGLLLLKRFMK